MQCESGFRQLSAEVYYASYSVSEMYISTKNKQNKNTSISQILDTFNKIKDNHFQGRKKIKAKRHEFPSVQGTNLVSPESHRSSSLKHLHSPKSEVHTFTGKRMSLPSIFHPLMPLSKKVSHTKERKTIRLTGQGQGQGQGQGPRVTLSQMLQAYSKAELPEVEVKGPEYEYQQYLEKERREKAAGGLKHNIPLPRKVLQNHGRSLNKKEIEGNQSLPPVNQNGTKFKYVGKQSRVLPF